MNADGWYWDEDVAYAKYPVQLFAMYYLTDTRRENGCLRVIPGSCAATAVQLLSLCSRDLADKQRVCTTAAT